MVLSEEKNKDQLKSGLIAVAVLLVLGALAPTIIGEFTGVDLDTLMCDDDNDPTTAAVACLDDGDFKTAIFEAMGYVSLVIALVGFVGLIWVAVRY